MNGGRAAQENDMDAEMRKAQAKRLRDRGEFTSKVKAQTKATGKSWTPAQRAKLSRAMKAAHRRKTAAAAAKSATA